MSLRQMSEHTGINRATLKNVEADGGARGTSVSAYRAALEKLEHETGMDMPDADESPNEMDLVEFQVAGNFGVRVVVKGPVRDRHELEETVMRLIERLQTEQGSQSPDA
jgi:hypothetical protein